MSDPLLRALRDANPVSEEDFAALPPLSPPRRRAAPAAVIVAVAAIVAAVVALVPSGTPGSRELLQRALAAGDGGAEILYWRLQTTDTGLKLTFTDDVWMHVRADGTLDVMHERRLDGRYAGNEVVTDQPHGFGDLRGAVTRDRSPDGPIRTTKGLGAADVSLGQIVALAQRAAHGQVDVGAATSVRYGGRAAWRIRVREPSGPVVGTRRNPSELGVTMWIDRETDTPLAIQWGEGAELWRVSRVQAFHRYPDDAAHRALLGFG